MGGRTYDSERVVRSRVRLAVEAARGYRAGVASARVKGEQGGADGVARAPRGRTCALDPGTVRVGVAIDDELGLLAHPRGALDAGNRKALLAALRVLAEQETVVRFVVGLPLDMHGGEGMAARGARTLAQQVADATGRAVELWDERLTTVEAQRSLRASEVRGKKARARIDEAAACAILQSWLDARRGHDGR
jgi:putative holliday junction resolvase